jgi:hypothetical protein
MVKREIQSVIECAIAVASRCAVAPGSPSPRGRAEGGHSVFLPLVPAAAGTRTAQASRPVAGGRRQLSGPSLRACPLVPRLHGEERMVGAASFSRPSLGGGDPDGTGPPGRRRGARAN